MKFKRNNYQRNEMFWNYQYDYTRWSEKWYAHWHRSPYDFIVMIMVSNSLFHRVNIDLTPNSRKQKIGQQKWTKNVYFQVTRFQWLFLMMIIQKRKLTLTKTTTAITPLIITENTLQITIQSFNEIVFFLYFYLAPVYLVLGTFLND